MLATPMRGLVLTGVLFLLAAASSASAQTAAWHIDPGHSSAQFAVRHMLIATVHGEFDGPSGTVSFDPKDVAGTLKADATINAKSISTRNAERDRDLKSELFLNVTKFPAITFKSKKAAAAGPGRFTVTGDLTIHGVTREVTLNVEGPTPAVKDLDGLMRAGATMTTTLNRRDFGLQYNVLIEAGGAVVADEVKVTIDLEFTRRLK
jgi:polyisoprenoid-binding protein YceI